EPAGDADVAGALDLALDGQVGRDQRLLRLGLGCGAGRRQLGRGELGGGRRRLLARGRGGGGGGGGGVVLPLGRGGAEDGHGAQILANEVGTGPAGRGPGGTSRLARPGGRSAVTRLTDSEAGQGLAARTASCGAARARAAAATSGTGRRGPAGEGR